MTVGRRPSDTIADGVARDRIEAVAVVLRPREALAVEADGGDDVLGRSARPAGRATPGDVEEPTVISKRLAAIPAAGLLVASPAGAADAPDPDGVTPLVNGRDLAGWRVPDGDNGPWKVGGGRYRLRREGGAPSSSVTDGQQIDVTPAAALPVLAGIAPFRIRDETYKNLSMSPKVRPLLTADNPTGVVNLARVGACATARVVAIPLGHGRPASGHPSRRAPVHDAVRRAADKAE